MTPESPDLLAHVVRRTPSPGPAEPRRERRWLWPAAVWALLACALALRLWGLRHGLPFVYNVDEASNFVPTAISFFYTVTYDPNYFVNPPAFSYLLHGLFALWFRDTGHAYATD